MDAIIGVISCRWAGQTSNTADPEMYKVSKMALALASFHNKVIKQFGWMGQHDIR